MKFPEGQPSGNFFAHESSRSRSSYNTKSPAAQAQEEAGLRPSKADTFSSLESQPITCHNLIVLDKKRFLHIIKPIKLINL